MASPPPTLNRDDRKRCKRAKDDYWKCLDANKDDATKCMEFKQQFEDACPKQWVEYFCKRREFNEFRQTQDKTGYVIRSY